MREEGRGRRKKKGGEGEERRGRERRGRKGRREERRGKGPRLALVWGPER